MKQQDRGFIIGILFVIIYVILLCTEKIVSGKFDFISYNIEFLILGICFIYDTFFDEEKE